MRQESKTVATLKGQLFKFSGIISKQFALAQAQADQGDALWDTGLQGCETE